MFSIFHALGLKVGVHPIIRNRSESVGGLSAKKLRHGPTVARKGDFVENCLKNMSAKTRHLGEDEEDYCEFDDEGNGTQYYHSLPSYY